MTTEIIIAAIILFALIYYFNEGDKKKATQLSWFKLSELPPLSNYGTPDPLLRAETKLLAEELFNTNPNAQAIVASYFDSHFVPPPFSD